jgi:aminoglycoside 6-adenylyltransferase
MIVRYNDHMSYAKIEETFVAWVTNEPNIRAALVVGSYARTHKSADEWSDLDLIFFTTTPDAYFANNEWLHQMGEVWLSVPNEALASNPEWLVLYRGGFKVDYMIAPATDTLYRLVQAPLYEPALRRGYRVLIDKDQSGADKLVLPYATRCFEPPTPAAFSDLVKRLLLFGERTAKVLSRGELWRAKYLCDNLLKNYLLLLLEWHACAVNGMEHDTWRNGRFLHDWVCPKAAARLPPTFATYDIEDMWRATLATLELGCHLARETAALWQYDYPQQTEQEVLAWIRTLRDSS